MQAFLLFSHQLFPIVARRPRDTVIYLLEDSRLFRSSVDQGKAIFHRAALQAMRERLLVKGFAVRYLGADEYPELSIALKSIASEHPEKLQFYTLGDKNLTKQLNSLLKKAGISFEELASPTPPIKLIPRQDYIPTVLPPIEPNRYVLEAARYFAQMVKDSGEVSFAYPVTPGDAEEWLDVLPDYLKTKKAKDVVCDIVPLLMAGLIDLTTLEKTLTPQAKMVFHSLLIG